MAETKIIILDREKDSYIKETVYKNGKRVKKVITRQEYNRLFKKELEELDKSIKKLDLELNKIEGLNLDEKSFAQKFKELEETTESLGIQINHITEFIEERISKQVLKKFIIGHIITIVLFGVIVIAKMLLQ